MEQRKFTREFKPEAARLIKERGVPCMLLHTAATLLIETGVDIRFVRAPRAIHAAPRSTPCRPCGCGNNQEMSGVGSEADLMPTSPNDHVCVISGPYRDVGVTPSRHSQFGANCRGALFDLPLRCPQTGAKLVG